MDPSGGESEIRRRNPFLCGSHSSRPLMRSITRVHERFYHSIHPEDEPAVRANL